MQKNNTARTISIKILFVYSIYRAEEIEQSRV